MALFLAGIVCFIKTESQKVIMKVFKPGRIIKEFELKGRKVVFRYPKPEDWKALWRNYKSTIKDTNFMGRETPPSQKESREWISKTIEELKKRVALMLVAEVDGIVAGTCDVRKLDREVRKHQAEFGINIIKDYREIGLGTEMIKAIMGIARDMGIEILKLNVVSDNSRARHVYEKCGFKVYGKIPKGFKRKTGYQDEILMMREI